MTKAGGCLESPGYGNDGYTIGDSCAWILEVFLLDSVLRNTGLEPLFCHFLSKGLGLNGAVVFINRYLFN